MVQRLSVIVLALFVAAAPAALTACELMCAAREAGTSPTAHSCHETEPDDTEGSTMAAAPHACGHVASLPSASAKVTLTSSDALPPTTAASQGFVNDTGVSRVAHAPPHRPVLFARLTPLRI